MGMQYRKGSIRIGWLAAVLLLLTFTLRWNPTPGQDWRSESPLAIAATQGQNAQASQPVVEKDIAYAEGGDERKLDLYLPEQKGFTTIVFIYGCASTAQRQGSNSSARARIPQESKESQPMNTIG